MRVLDLHDVAQLRGVEVLFGDGAEKVDPPLVDAQDELGGQQPDGVLNLPHREENRVPYNRRSHGGIHGQRVLSLQADCESWLTASG
jgi:hypothetical protein